MKVCKECSKIKNEDEFYHKYRKICIVCQLEKERLFYQEHREEILEELRIWRSNNKEEVNRKKKARRDCPIRKLKRNISSLILKSLGFKIFSKKESKNIISNLGKEYFIQLKSHFEELFKKEENQWMNWNNFDKNSNKQKTWRLYYIQSPLDLTYNSITDNNFKIIWNIQNIIPLTSEEYSKRIRRETVRRKKLNDPSRKLRHNISNSIYSYLKEQKSSKYGKSIKEYLGEDYFEKLKLHIEQQFIGEKSWMNFNNYGKYNQNRRTWNLDHIIPHSSFKYTSMDSQEFKECWALNNLQPLEAMENIKKGSKI